MTDTTKENLDMNSTDDGASVQDRAQREQDVVKDRLNIYAVEPGSIRRVGGFTVRKTRVESPPPERLRLDAD